MAVRRLLSQWRSLLTVIAGTLLGASVGALIPLYTTTVSQVSMVERLNQLPPESVHAAADFSLVPSQTDKFDEAVRAYDGQFHELIRRRIGEPFPGWLDRVVFYGETSPLATDLAPVVTEEGGQPTIPDPTTRVYVAYYEGWTEAVSLVSGRLPMALPAEPGVDIEIVVPLDVQNNLGINLGDVLTLDQGGPRGGWPSSRNILARVVGIVNLPEQLTPLARAYFMPPSPLRVVTSTGEYQAEFPVLTTRATFERVAREFVPDTPTRFGWRLLFDHTRLPFSRSPEARQALRELENDLTATFNRPPPADQPTARDIQFNYHTGLIDWQTQGGENFDAGALLAYERNVRTLDAPFGLLLLQIGALVIFFLVATAALVRRGERREIAMLQSRGAVDRHIVVIRGIEALLICAVAAIAAPVVSQQLLIAITPFFARYPNLPLLLTPTVFTYATVAAAIAFLALMFTLRPVLRLPLITSGGTTLRSEKQPWWQRSYLDVLLVVLGVAALWRLVGRDTPLFTSSAGGRTTDPFLLLAPALLFLGLGSVLLRLFPAIAAGAARTLAVGRGLVGPMATWQLSREPIHYGRITFLLALAIGIGWFATSFRATVDRSQNDQAQYKVGTDIRLNERDTRLNAARARLDAGVYTQIPGVQATSVAWRQPNVNFEPDPRKNAVLGELLAIDSDTFRQTTYWRPDLGALNTPREPGQATRLPERGLALPFAPQKLYLWANFTVRGAFGMYYPDLDRLRYRTTIYARLLDGAGAWIEVPFRVAEVEYMSTGPQAPGLGGGGAFQTNGWTFLEADLRALSYKPVEPLRLVSLYWQHRGRAQQGENYLRLTLAGLSGSGADGQKHPLGLLDAPGWEFAYDSGAPSQGEVHTVFADGRRGQGIAAEWNQSAASATLGALLNYPSLADVPMLASTSLSAQLALQPGQLIQVRDLERLTVPMRVVGNQKFYPSLYDAFVQDGRWVADQKNHPFAVVDRDALLYMLNRRPSAALYPDEVWLRLKTALGSDTSAILRTLRPADRSAAVVTAQTLPGELANLQTDPLSRGLLGLMFLAFLIAMSLSIVGLLTYAALTATARQSEFGVLRAMGLSAPRLIGQLALEQSFVIGLGTLLGAALGAVLSSQVVPRLALDTTSKNITPPFIVQVEAGALAQYGALILGVLVLVLLISLLLVRRLSMAQTLRLGEE